MPRLVTLLTFATLALPAGVALAQPLVYVTDPDAGTMTAVDSGNNTVTRTLSNLSGPDAVAIKSDGTRIYVAESASGKIAVFDGTKIANPNENPLIKEIDVGGQPVALALSLNEQTLYVADAANNQAEAVDLNSGNVSKTYAAGSGVTSLALSPDGHLLAIGSSNKTITLYALSWQQGGSAQKTLVNLSAAPKALEFDPQGRTLWIATGASYASYDRVSGAVSEHSKSGGTTSVSYDARQGVVYFGAGSGNVVYEYTPGTGLQQIGVYGPVSGLALSADGTRLYASQKCSNCGLAVINTSQGQAIAQTHFGTAPVTAGEFAGPGAIYAENAVTDGEAGDQVSGTVSATDGAGRALAYASIADPAQGQLALDSTGDYTYTPPSGYSGLQSFVWQASASSGQGSPTQPRSQPITQALAVFPTVTGIADQSADPAQTVGPFPFTIVGTVPLDVTITSTNKDVVNPSKATLSAGCGTTSLNCSLTLVVGDASGSSTQVTVQAIDPSGLDGSTTFKLTTSGSGVGGSGALAPVALLLLAGMGGLGLVRRRRDARL